MRKNGFTLMEMLTVVIIVGVLAAVALPQYRKVVEKSHFTKAQVMAKAMYDSCERLVAEWGVENYAALSSSVRTLSRTDIGSAELLPVGFSMNGETVTGAGFTYTLTTNPTDTNTGACYVSIEKTKGVYAGVKLGYNGTGFTCSDNATACEIYGLD